MLIEQTYRSNLKTNSDLGEAQLAKPLLNGGYDRKGWDSLPFWEPPKGTKYAK